MDLLRQSRSSCRLGGRNDVLLRCVAKGIIQPLDRFATLFSPGANSEIVERAQGIHRASSERRLRYDLSTLAPSNPRCSVRVVGFFGKKWIRAFSISKGFLLIF